MYDDVTNNTHTQLFINNQITCGLCTLFVEHIFKCALSEDCNATGVVGLHACSPELPQRVCSSLGAVSNVERMTTIFLG